MHYKMKVKFQSKKIMAIGLAVLLIATSLYSIGVNAFLSPSQGAETQELQVAVLSEPRIFPQSMISHGPAFNEVVSSDIAMLSESQAILDAAVSEIIRQAPDVLLVPGNLTREGEIDAHMHLAARLNQIKAALPDINIYVINGSRDINNPSARSFVSGVPVSVPSATPEGFRTIYNNLGYGDATSIYFAPPSGQAGANSYVARPAPGFTVIAIDTASGGIGAELLNWITEQAQVANSRGDTVIAFMHHSLLPHSSIQATHFVGTLLDGHEYVSSAFAEAGIRYVFTSAMRATNIAQVTIGENTLTDIGTASLTAFPSPIRFANFVRGVNAENRMTETVEISTSRIQAINYIDSQTGQNITNLSEYSSRMVTPEVVVSLILDSGLYDIMHEVLDEMEATEFVNTRGVRHTGLRAVLESAFPTEDAYGNPLSNCLGDVFIDLLREVLPTTEAEGMDLGGIGVLWYEIPQNRIRVRILGGFAGNVFMTDANIRNHLINPGFAQLNNNLLVDRTIINEAINQLGHDLLAMNVYPLPQPDGEGGYTDAGNQHTLFDLVRHAYLTHLAGDEQAEQWMLDVINHLNDGGPLLNSVVDLVLLSLGVALDDVLHTVIINTGQLVTSDLLGTAGRLAVVAFLGNNLGSIMSGFGFSAVEMMGELGDILSEEELGDLATVLTDTFLGLLVNYGYPRDNFTALHWVGDEVTIPVDRDALRALIVEAVGLNQEDYTPESWAALAAALSAAHGAYNNEDATQTQIDVATTNLRQAIDNLEEAVIHVDRDALRALIVEATGLNQEDYTPESWAALTAALSAAQGVYNNENATQDQVDIAAASLRQAIDNLVEVCDDCSRYPCECPELCADCNRYPCECPELCADCNRYPCECPKLCDDCNRYPCECPELCVDCNRYPCECPELCADCNRYPCECPELCGDCNRYPCECPELCADCNRYPCECPELCIDCNRYPCECPELCVDCNRYPCECPELCADCNRYPCECPELCADCNRYPCECVELCADCNRYPCECPELCINCNRYPCECVEIDRTALGLLIIEAVGLNEEDFTPVSWSALQATLSAAQTVYNNENATQEQIDVAATNLRQAIDNLVEVCDDCSRYPCECPELCADCNRYPCECPELCDDCNRYPCECPELCVDCNRYPCECPELCADCNRYPCECPELCADCNRYPCECPELCVDCNRYPCECPELCIDCNRYPCECPELCADCNRYPCECLELCVDCNRYPCECPELCDDCNKYPCECLEVDRAALSLLIAAAEIRLEENYTASSWAIFIEALEVALAVYEDVDATQEEIDLAKQALIYAKNGLIDVTIPPVPCEDCEEYPCNCPELCDDCNRHPCNCPEVCDDCNRYPCNCPELCGDCNRHPCNCPELCDDCNRHQCNCPAVCRDCKRHPCRCQTGDNRRPARPNDQPVPKTGDNANMNLWIMLFTLGLFGFVATSTKLTANITKKNYENPSIVMIGDDGKEHVISL